MRTTRLNHARHRLEGCALALALGALAGACASAPKPPSALGALEARPGQASAAAPSESLPFVSPASYEQLIRAELYLSRGQTAQALEAYRAAIAFGEEDPYLLARFALALDAAGQQREAREVLAAALAIEPRSEAAWLAAARIARARGDQDAAQRAYERACEGSASPATALERIEHLRALGNHERASAALNELAARAGASVRDRLRIDLELAIANQKPDALARCARDWAALVPVHSEPALGRRAASALLQGGRPHAALQLLEALPVAADDAALRLEALLALGRTAQCEHLLATTPPEWLGGPVALARAYLAIDRPDAALAALEERAPTARDDHADRAQLASRALVELGRPPSAASALTAALLDPTQRATAARALEAALQASALPALGREIAAAQ